MLQSSITAWLQKPASVKKPIDSSSTTTLRANAPTVRPETSAPPPECIADQIEPAKVEAPNSPPPKLQSLPPLPANVELVPLTEELIPGFKRLNALTLPIPYPASYYAETMTEPHHGITLMALWHSKPPKGTAPDPEKPRLVGAIRCRILPSSTLYISTLGLLTPFRSHGIASHMLQQIVVKAVELHGVKCITAHVWEANEEGMEWYQKRGFEILGKEEGYYRKIKPTGAFLVRKWIGVGDLLSDAADSRSKVI